MARAVHKSTFANVLWKTFLLLSSVIVDRGLSRLSDQKEMDAMSGGSIVGLLTTFYIVISRSELRDRDWFNARHVMCKNKQCCPVLSVQRHVPGEHGANHVTPCICVDFFGWTTVLGRSICILCFCVMDDDTYLLHFISINIEK